MEDNFEAQILKRLGELPEKVRAAIQSANLHTSLQEIAAKHHLHIDQISELEDETYLVMLGFSSSDSFAERIASALTLPQSAAEAVAHDVNDKIFFSIRDAMKAFAPSKAPEPASPPAKPAEVHPAEMMLTAPTITKAPPPPKPALSAPITPAPTPKPQPTPPAMPKSYATDPYREPI